jgi:ParB family chromosome partitioning protein
MPYKLSALHTEHTWQHFVCHEVEILRPRMAKRRGIKLKPTDMRPGDLLLRELPAELDRLAQSVAEDGGTVLAAYREPLGGHALLLVALPIERVAPTPFQRDISDAHVRRLERAMDKTNRFLDPIIVVREQRAAVTDEKGEAADHRYWVPNGYHRLTALKELGAKTILGLLVPETAVDRIWPACA